MSLSLALSLALLTTPADVPDSEWSRVEAEFLTRIRKDDLRARREAAESLARVPDRRAPLLLWKTIEKQVKGIGALEQERAAREAAVQKLERDLEKSGFQARSATGRRSSAGAELEKRRDAVRAAIDEQGHAREGLDLYCKALAGALSRLEGDAYAQSLKPLCDVASSPKASFEIREAAINTLRNCESSETRDLLLLLLADPDARIRVRTLVALAARKDSESVDRIVAALRDPEWPVRAAAVSALVEIKSKTSIPYLIEALDREKGRLCDDIERALVALTGRNFHSSVPLWREWWVKEGPTFVVPGTPEAQAAVKAEKSDKSETPRKFSLLDPTRTSFYGIETQSLKVLFILDVSGSMADPDVRPPSGSSASHLSKLSAAQEELRRSLLALPPEATFNIIAYSSSVDRWQKTMQPATRENKERAVAWIRAIPAKGGTDIYDALSEGFEIAGVGATDPHYDAGADTIFFLTDGRPTLGPITDVERILAEVRRKNALARVVVHCVGVGEDADESFLSRLASENAGKHVKK